MATRRIQVVLTEQMYAALHTESLVSGLSMGTIARLMLRRGIAHGDQKMYQLPLIHTDAAIEAAELADKRAARRKAQ